MYVDMLCKIKLIIYGQDADRPQIEGVATHSGTASTMERDKCHSMYVGRHSNGRTDLSNFTKHNFSGQ